MGGHSGHILIVEDDPSRLIVPAVLWGASEFSAQEGPPPVPPATPCPLIEPQTGTRPRKLIEVVLVRPVPQPFQLAPDFLDRLIGRPLGGERVLNLGKRQLKGRELDVPATMTTTCARPLARPF
jgi:hypothetical protein